MKLTRSNYEIEVLFDEYCFYARGNGNAGPNAVYSLSKKINGVRVFDFATRIINESD
ncbi:hypothetical protein [Aliikangiella sp. IMCC44359]|uniref:hypothetical protein n=1 Tax=Aliikangiella sp. IMCC44359 TaxID=3459125 RepID=UPI00403A9536